MFNGSLVVRNEVSMGYMFSAMQTRVVKGNVMKDIGPKDEIAANVKHRYAENSAIKGIAALKNYEPVSKMPNEEYENQIYSCPKYVRLGAGSNLEKLIYVRKVETSFAYGSEICNYTVFKNGFDEKRQLKVVVVNTFMTFASSQFFVSDVQKISFQIFHGGHGIFCAWFSLQSRTSWCC